MGNGGLAPCCALLILPEAGGEIWVLMPTSVGQGLGGTYWLTLIYWNHGGRGTVLPLVFGWNRTDIAKKGFLLLCHSFCSPFTKENKLFWSFFFICLLVGLFSRLMECPVQDIWKATRKPRELTTVLFLKSRGTFVVCLLFNSSQSLPMLFCCVMSRDFFFYGQVLGGVKQLHFGKTEILCSGLLLIKG